jgi:hypothetical protein
VATVTTYKMVLPVISRPGPPWPIWAIRGESPANYHLYMFTWVSTKSVTKPSPQVYFERAAGMDADRPWEKNSWAAPRSWIPAVHRYVLTPRSAPFPDARAWHEFACLPLVMRGKVSLRGCR